MESDIVLKALGVTFIVFVCLTIFAWVSPIDFGIYHSMMGIVLIIFFLFGLVYMFFPRTTLTEIIWGSIGTIIFSFYIIIDTQIIVGNSKVAWPPDEYILAVLKLYIDIVNLFLYILRIFRASK